MELLVAALIVVGFAAIVARFLPRDAVGRVRLPRIVDDSIGMYLLRRARGRPTWVDDADGPAPTRDGSAEQDEIAWRIGMPGAPAPTMPARFIASEAPPQAHPIRPGAALQPVTPRAPLRRVAPGRVPSSLALQRRLAGLVALLVVAVAVGAIAFLPRTLEGDVLSATSSPGVPEPSRFAVAPSVGLEPSPTADSSDDLPIQSPPSAAPTIPPVAGPTDPPTPAATVRPTVRPTPTPPPTPAPTPRPTPKPTAPPTPSPTPTPTPSPVPSPPEAWIDASPECGASPLLVQFDGSASQSETGYVWSFGDGASSSAAAPQHTFESNPSGWLVTLTVTGPGGADSASVRIYVDKEGGC